MSSDDSERATLMSADGQKQKKTPDWSRFGLSNDKQNWSPQQKSQSFGSNQQGDEQQNELFREEQVLFLIFKHQEYTDNTPYIHIGVDPKIHLLILPHLCTNVRPE